MSPNEDGVETDADERIVIVDGQPVVRKANAEPDDPRSRRAAWAGPRPRTLDEVRKAADGGEPADPEPRLKNQDDLDGRHPWNKRLREVDRPTGRNSRDDSLTAEQRARLAAAEAAERAIEESPDPDMSQVDDRHRGPSAVDLTREDVEDAHKTRDERIEEHLEVLAKQLRAAGSDATKPLGELEPNADRGRSDTELRDRWSRLLDESDMLDETLDTLDGGRFDEAAQIVAGHFGIPVDRARAVVGTLAMSKAVGGAEADADDLQAVVEAVAEFFGVSVDAVLDALEDLGDGAGEAVEEAEKGQPPADAWTELADVLAD